MSSRAKRCATRLATGLVCLMLVPGAMAQDSLQRASSSLGLLGGFSWPLGDWAKSRVDPSASLFVAGPSFHADLEVGIGSRWTLAFAFGYASLNGGDWEECVSSKGGAIEVSAYAMHLAVLLRPHILLKKTDIVRIEVGPALLLASGSETYEGRTYQYDFLKESCFGFRGGVDYTRLLTESLGISLNAAILVFPSGVEYVAGESQTILSLPVTLGVRFLF